MTLTVYIKRGSEIESIHSAFAVAVDRFGDIICSIGDPQHITCIRSSLKPFQACAGVESGAFDKYKLSNAEIALTCSSHNAELIHTETAIKILDKIKLSINSLECGKHPAHHQKTRKNMTESKTPYTAIHNNCSGKHSGMLCLTKFFNYPIKGYIDINHPTQQYILNSLYKYSKIKNPYYGIDGCSVPTPFYTLKTIAEMYQKIGNPNDSNMCKIYSAMRDHPYLIAGDGRFDSSFIKALKGRGIAKGGGEAIQGITIKTKKHGVVGIAIKILDGSHRARASAIMKFLTHFKLLERQEIKELNNFISPAIINHNKTKTGYIESVIK